ncbi:protein VACUOLELESS GAMETOPHYTES-like [Mercurialis annua]|uniref:protein VACUOLELESS GAMETOPHYTES-like n=1 Tax=Mercurialis annua TaxID=3986 RepID=UPI00215EDF60|nr:protein VACUOLELESS GAMETOPHYTES-like [Mercurialis annua]
MNIYDTISVSNQKMSSSIFSYKHLRGPDHELDLKLRAPVPGTSCHVCHQQITSGYYTCRDSGCGFVAHRQCAPCWPRYAGHPQHPLCWLKLVQPPDDTHCLACRSVCSTWRYRCMRCQVDVHRPCILKSDGEPRRPPLPQPANDILPRIYQ